MRTLGWLLTIGGVIVSLLTYLDISDLGVEVNWAANGAVFLGLATLIYTRKLTLDEGERLYYRGTAQGGEGSALQADLGQSLKVAVTSKGLRYGGLFASKQKQALVPLETITHAEKLGPLSVRISVRSQTADSVSMKLKFAFWQTNRFLNALRAIGVQVSNQSAVAPTGGMDV